MEQKEKVLIAIREHKLAFEVEINLKELCESDCNIKSLVIPVEDLVYNRVLKKSMLNKLQYFIVQVEPSYVCKDLRTNEAQKFSEAEYLIYGFIDDLTYDYILSKAE